MMVMGLFAVFWLSFGFLQLPTLQLAAPYSATGSEAQGLLSPEYNAVVALYLIIWGFALLTFFVFTLKTNACFAGIFLFVTVGSWLLAGAYYHVANGHDEMAGKLQKAGGACMFVVACLGWYQTFVMMAMEMRFGVNFPVGDLSHFWPDTNVTLSQAEKQA